MGKHLPKRRNPLRIMPLKELQHLTVPRLQKLLVRVRVEYEVHCQCTHCGEKTPELMELATPMFNYLNLIKEILKARQIMLKELRAAI